MPNVISVQLHGNHMQTMSSVIYESLPHQCFHTLQVLALNNCNIQSYAELVLISKCLVHIEELYLSNNNLQDLSIYKNQLEDNAASTLIFNTVSTSIPSYYRVLNVLPHLRILDISHCKITSWDAILSLFAIHHCDNSGYYKSNQSIEVMPTLTDLLIDGNDITYIPKRTMQTVGLSKLLRLSASCTQ